jgi:caffeoyl-CoA O-methyltransferase
MVNTLSKARPVTPFGILVQHLAQAVSVAATAPDIPDDLAHYLQEAYQIGQNLDPYLHACTTPESEALRRIAEATAQENWRNHHSQGATVKALEQEMLSGHLEGQTLKMFVAMTHAQSVLDIGMFTGYSALAMAEGLPENGRLVACEIDPYTAQFARDLFAQSEHGHKIEVKVAPALDTLTRLAQQGESFDFVFIDAEKTEYEQYYQMLLERGLLAPEGWICVDNTLLQGQPYLPSPSVNGQAIKAFNEMVKNDPRVEQVLLPVRDGLTIIRQV